MEKTLSWGLCLSIKCSKTSSLFTQYTSHYCPSATLRSPSQVLPDQCWNNYLPWKSWINIFPRRIWINILLCGISMNIHLATKDCKLLWALSDIIIIGFVPKEQVPTPSPFTMCLAQSSREYTLNERRKRFFNSKLCYVWFKEKLKNLYYT